MVLDGVLETASLIASPFLKNPQLLYLLVLLVVGVDSYMAFVGFQVPTDLPEGTVYIIDQDFFGNKVCATTTSVGLANDLGVDTYRHLADSKELAELCQTPTAQGTVGRVFTSIVGGIGFASGNEFLQKEVNFLSWQIFIFMIVLPFIVWGVTASTRS